MTAVLVLVASACLWPPGDDVNPVVVAALGGGSIQGRSSNVVPEDDGGGVLVDRVFVEAGARIAADGAVEVGARVNGTDLWWQPTRRLFDYRGATVGEWWTSSPIGPAEVGVSTARIRVRRLGEGSVEFAVLTPGGAELRPRRPRLAYEDLTADAWTYATPVVLTATAEPAPRLEPVTADPDRFVEISLWHRSGCGLRADLTVDCWGRDDEGQATAPEGAFAALGLDSNCGIRTDGTAGCLSRRGYLEGPFVAISRACGVRPDGRVDCADKDESPDGHFVTITYGEFAPVFLQSYHCGVRVSGELACWGDDTAIEGPGSWGDPQALSGWAEPPDGLFTTVTAGSRHTCGIRINGRVQCWGDNLWGQSSAPLGDFTALSAARTYTCGLYGDRRASCWGGQLPMSVQGQYEPPAHSEHGPAPAPLGVFTAIASTDDRTCGLRPDGTVDCWYPAAFYEPRRAVLFDFSKEDGYGRWRPVYQASHVPAGEFGDVAPGGRHGCGLHADGSVACWGDDSQGQASAPTSRFSKLSSGGWHTCGILTEGSIRCWGNDSHGQTIAPDGVFHGLSTGWEHACGLRGDGSLACWGNDGDGQATSPEGIFDMVASGGRHSCGILADQSLACWGSNSHGQATAPTGAFSAVAAGALHTCGLRTDGTAVCRGDNRFGQSSAPDGSFAALIAGADYSCGLRPGGTAECWGGDHPRYGVGGQDWTVHNPPPATPPPGPFIGLRAGSQIACGLRADSTSECWIATGLRTIETPPSLTATRAPRGTFNSLSAGAYHTCAISDDDTLTCWGENTHAQATPPPGAHQSVTAGERHTCAIRNNHTITCWGDNTFGQASTPDGTFESISAGSRHNCAIGGASRLTCWGDDTYGQATPPPGAHRSVTAGERHTCAIRNDHTITCWGDNTHHQTHAAPGKYDSITAGRFDTCARRLDSTVECWGLTFTDETTMSEDSAPDAAPAGTFTAISAGTRHTCGIRPGRHVECWPHYSTRSGTSYEVVALGWWYYDAYSWRDGRATPLPGPFTAISAGTYHTCGIRPDGTIDCWSANEPRNR